LNPDACGSGYPGASTAQPWRRREWQAHTQILLDSFRRRLGRDLIEREGDAEAQAQALFEAPFVVVSHGTQDDPILNYGNRTALALWEMDLETLLRTPSRLTAEPVAREERERMLRRAAEDGYIDDYRGVRIASSGRRFEIEQAIIWNLRDEEDRPAGQAASFADWRFLDG
jgi:hypothetical protein